MRLSFDTVDGLCANIDTTESRPTIDMSTVTFVEPFGMVYLLMFIRHFNKRGRFFRIVEPKSSRASQYLMTQRFWERCNADRGESIAWGMANWTSFNDVVDITQEPYVADDVESKILDILAHEGIVIDRYLVAETAAELVDNFRRHSVRGVGACALQYYPSLSRLHFAVGDHGVGIRHSLAQSPRFVNIRNLSDDYAAMRAMVEGVSSRHEGGMGFPTILQNIRDLKGEFFLSTGRGSVRYSGDVKRLRRGKMRFPLPGVQVHVEIPITKGGWR